LRLLASNHWVFPLNPTIFGVDAMVLYYLMYGSGLVPKWLSVWGLIGALLGFVSGLTGIFGTQIIYLAVPIAVQEMDLAVWLLAKGFNTSVTSAVARGDLYS
jgi:hypothetical protein